MKSQPWRAHSAVWRPQGKFRACWRDNISHLAWECLGTPQEEIESVAEERNIWNTLLEWMDGWEYRYWGIISDRYLMLVSLHLYCPRNVKPAGVESSGSTGC